MARVTILLEFVFKEIRHNKYRNVHILIIDGRNDKDLSPFNKKKINFS